jgi:hypothetical protein
MEPLDGGCDCDDYEKSIKQPNTMILLLLFLLLLLEVRVAVEGGV